MESYLVLVDVYRQMGRPEDAAKVRRSGFEAAGQPLDGPMAFMPGGGPLMERPEQLERKLEGLLSVLRKEPRNFHTYYFVLKTLELQNKYSARDVVNILDEASRADPALQKNVTFAHYRSLFSDQKSWEERLYRWLAHDLDEIAELCRLKGIRLIIHDYPYPYLRVNEELRKAAQRHGLPFVSHQAVFDKLVAAEPREKYFADDDHCTAAGHSVMVEGIYKVLRESGAPGGASRS
jgi:hypothetical protein